MLNKLRGFSNTKLAGVLITIIIIPFVFWGMGSVFSGGNSNNVAKINNETISTQDFINYINESRIDNDYIQNNIENNIIERIISEIVSKKLLNMEIDDLKLTISEKTLVKIIKKNEYFLDDQNQFSRIKYEKFLLENNLNAPDFELKLKIEELKGNLFSYISGGIKSPDFLINKVFNDQEKNVEIDYFNLDLVYDKETSASEIDEFINENEENLKEEFIDVSYAKITPKNLIEIDDFNKEFFKKIDEIENGILNGNGINELREQFNLKLNSLNNYNNDNKDNDIHNEIYSKKNGERVQLVDKNDYYLLFEITKINKVLPDKSDSEFINRIKENLILKKKYEYNKNLFEKIQNKKLNDSEFLKISSGQDNIKRITIDSINNNKKFDNESTKLIYSLPINSFVLVTDVKNNIYLGKIINIYTKSLSEDKKKEYEAKSKKKIIDEIYNSYDLSLNEKYNVKVFQKTLDRIKNNFN
tara:strand:+ start:1116 stop:2531 length:1416 start_codon:yes stop_codon:yes gene_type:complete